MKRWERKAQGPINSKSPFSAFANCLTRSSPPVNFQSQKNSLKTAPGFEAVSRKANQTAHHPRPSHLKNDLDHTAEAQLAH